MPTATMAKQRYLASRLSRKSPRTAGATTRSTTATAAKTRGPCQRPRRSPAAVTAVTRARSAAGQAPRRSPRRRWIGNRPRSSRERPRPHDEHPLRTQLEEGDDRQEDDHLGEAGLGAVLDEGVEDAEGEGGQDGAPELPQPPDDHHQEGVDD